MRKYGDDIPADLFLYLAYNQVNLGQNIYADCYYELAINAYGDQVSEVALINSAENKLTLGKFVEAELRYEQAIIKYAPPYFVRSAHSCS